MERRLFLSLLGPAGWLLAQEAPTKQLTADELKKLLEEKKNKVFFLDVRESKELEELGTLEGYKNIPLSQVQSRLAEIPKDREVVIA